METVGIIAEYNPFHSGHRHQITQTRHHFPQNCGIVVVMSGHWVQQANCAIADKWTRAKLALEGGADLVLELPTPWATASAQRFARGAIGILIGTGIISHLSFGSESGNLASLQQVESTLRDESYGVLLKQQLKSGCNFPVARQKAVAQLLGTESQILESPNNILALEYLSALHFFNSTITPLTIPRQGSGFHTLTTGDKPIHTSATDLRAKIHQGNWTDTQNYLSNDAQALLQAQEIPSLSLCHRGILAKISSMSLSDWENLPDNSPQEGLPHLLWKCGKSAQSVEEFLSLAKNKRYPLSRLKRLLLWAFLGITRDNTPISPPYLRILACNPTGQALLQEMKTKASLPLLNKPSQIKHFSKECQSLFAQEVIYTDLYGLCFPNILPRGLEWKKSPVQASSLPGIKNGLEKVLKK